MKKLLSMMLVFALILSLALASCGENSSGTAETSGADGSTQDSSASGEPDGTVTDDGVSSEPNDTEPDDSSDDVSSDTAAPDSSETDLPEPKEELAFALLEGGASYAVTGIGTYPSLDIVIPDTYEGKPVTAIAERAFFRASDITSVTIPNGVTTIGKEAFSGCDRLSRVVIPDSVTSIASYAFNDCNRLTSVSLGSGLEKIGDYAFSNCNTLVEVINGSNLDISEGVRGHGDISYRALVVHDGETLVKDRDGYLFLKHDGVSYLLAYIGNHTDLTLPADFDGGNYEIYSYAFADSYGANAITKLTVPDGVTAIGDCAFANCEALTTVDIGAGCTRIGSRAFESCPKLASVVLGEGITEISLMAFAECTALTSIVIPSSVLKISGTAFEGCESLAYTTYEGGKYLGNTENPYHALIQMSDYEITSYAVHEKTKMIADYAVTGCEMLSSVTISNGVTHIGMGSFSGCTNLATVVLSNNLKLIGDSAFLECTALTSITIPRSVETIGYSAFSYCTSLESIGYAGTQAEWEGVSLLSMWNAYSAVSKVVCSDGEIPVTDSASD